MNPLHPSNRLREKKGEMLRKQDGCGGCYNKQEQRRKRKLFIDIPVAADYVVKCTTGIEHIDGDVRIYWL